jgi:hypothetical protein
MKLAFDNCVFPVGVTTQSVYFQQWLSVWGSVFCNRRSELFEVCSYSSYSWNCVVDRKAIVCGEEIVNVGYVMLSHFLLFFFLLGLGRSHAKFLGLVVCCYTRVRMWVCYVCILGFYCKLLQEQFRFNCRTFRFPVGSVGFFIDLIIPARASVLGSIRRLTEMCTRDLSWGVNRPVCRAANLNHIHVSIV